MNKVLVVILGTLLLVTMGCDYEAENSRKIQAISPDEYVKTVANEFFSSENVDTMDILKINKAIAFLTNTYAPYPSSVTGRPSIYLLIEDFKSILAGNINTLTTVINGFNNETGVYEANTDSQKWIRKAAANDSIVMYFKDQYNQNRQAIMAWYNTLGAPLNITLIRKTGSVTVSLPDKIMLKLRNLSASNDSALTITFNVIPNQSFTDVNMKLAASYLKYALNAATEVKDTALHINCSLTSNEKQIATYQLDGTGEYLLKGAIDRVDYTLKFGSYTSKLNILDKLYTTNHVKDANTLKDYLLSNSISGTYDNIKGICDIVNENMDFRVWNASSDLLCSATIFPVNINGSYTGAPYVNWIYGDSQDLNDFSSPAIKNIVYRLQNVLQQLRKLME
jgi:hypothetical protein